MIANRPTTKVSEEILMALGSVDKIITQKWKYEPHGLLSGRGGCSLYFMHRYLQTGSAEYTDLCLQIVEKEITFVNKNGLGNYLSIGIPSSSIAWSIDQLIKFDVLDESEKSASSEWVKSAIESTTEEEFTANCHDLFYGFIGKTIIVIEHDKELALPLVVRVLEALKKSAITIADKIHWQTPYPFHATKDYEKTINLGIPHGSCGILLFLLKCCDLYNLHEELKPLLKGSIDWLIDRLEKENNKLLYGYSSTPSGTGKLGWCYGDQAIAFTLLRYYETFNCERAKAKAYELIEQAAAKPMEQTGVQYYPKYGYYDMRICHGTSSVAYMWQKMYHITKDENIKALADKWINIMLDNLEIFLPQLDKIAELEKDNEMIDTSMGFLNGLSGVGLALIAFQNPKLSDWDKLLLLDRPGRG